MTLRDRLKALTAPCREVDAEIAEMFDFYEHEIGKREVRLWDGTWRSETWRPVPKFTASLDATVDLVEREMPNLPHLIEPEWSLQTAPGGYWACVGHEYSTESGALHTLPAVALLLALLDAKGIE